MSYINSVRSKIGHELIISVGATTLVFNDKKELLLNIRSDTNDWGIPGGGKKLNEEYYYKYPNGDEVDCVIALYQVKNYSGELKMNDEESTQLKFFSLDHLPELESRAKTIIDKFKKEKGNLI